MGAVVGCLLFGAATLMGPFTPRQTTAQTLPPKILAIRAQQQARASAEKRAVLPQRAPGA
jgi:hypothetical protein